MQGRGLAIVHNDRKGSTEVGEFVITLIFSIVSEVFQLPYAGVNLAL